MKVKLIAFGTRMPTWVDQAYLDYQKRLPREISLELIELPLPKRQKNYNIAQLLTKEADLMQKKIAPQDHVVTLDERGAAWPTKELAQQLENWLELGCDICLLVGGPDGLAPEIKQLAKQSWSLSALTLPHPIIRPIIAEQLYRAWSIINHHPYHRE